MRVRHGSILHVVEAASLLGSNSPCSPLPRGSLARHTLLSLLSLLTPCSAILPFVFLLWCGAPDKDIQHGQELICGLQATSEHEPRTDAPQKFEQLISRQIPDRRLSARPISVKA